MKVLTSPPPFSELSVQNKTPRSQVFAYCCNNNQNPGPKALPLWPCCSSMDTGIDSIRTFYPRANQNFAPSWLPVPEPGGTGPGPSSHTVEPIEPGHAQLARRTPGITACKASAPLLPESRLYQHQTAGAEWALLVRG